MDPDHDDRCSDEVRSHGPGLTAVGVRVGVGLGCVACATFFAAGRVSSAGVLWAPVLLLGCLLLFQSFRLLAVWQSGELSDGQPAYETFTSALARGGAMGVLALVVVPLISIGVAFSDLKLGAPTTDVHGCAFAQVNKGVTTCVSQASFDRANAAQYALGAGFLGVAMVVAGALEVGLSLGRFDTVRRRTGSPDRGRSHRT